MSKTQYQVSGKKLDFKATQQASELQIEKRPGGWIIVTDSHGKRTRFSATQARSTLGFLLHGKLWHGMLHTQTRGGASASADSDLVAQFPGKVRKILVQAGAKVEAGTPLVLLEAMKMEFSMKAPANGKVTKILVNEGQQLSPGDRLVDFEVAQK